MRIFISHGLDKKVSTDMQFLDRLQAALQAPAAGGVAHQVLLDRSQLALGDDWQHVLHELLAECDAAVLLLSPRALTRPWVLKEATILAYRKALQKDFPLYPVLLGGVAPADLDSLHFSPLCLQALQATAHPAITAASARVVAKDLQARLAAWLAQVGKLPATPLAALEQALQARLLRADDLQALQQLCETLTGRPLQWQPGAGAAAGPARLIAATLVNGLGEVAGQAGGHRSGSPLADLLLALYQQCGLGRDDAAQVLQLLAPLWTRPADAARLADAAGRNRLPATLPLPPGTSVALHCELGEFCAEQHVRRALMPTPRKQVICTLAGGHSDNRLEELKAGIRQEYRRLHKTPASVPDSKVDERLASTDIALDVSRTAFFLIPDPLPDAALLAELQACFPRLTFILHSLAPLPDPLPPRVLGLQPIDSDHEYRMNEDLGAALNLIDP